MPSEVTITMYFDQERFEKDFNRKLVLAGASNIDAVSKEMAENARDYITVGTPKDILEAEVIE